MTPRTRWITISGVVALAAAWWGLREPVGDVPSDGFVAWAGKRAVPIATPEAGTGFADLQPWRQIVGSARLVGLGEATHGTREFFQFKHRMLEFLVKEMGFTALAMETDFTRARRVNDYVLGGPGSALEVVQQMGYWIWDTEEIVALVEWMRQHNLGSAGGRKVQFFGFDVQDVEAPVVETLRYLRTVDPGAAREFETLDVDYAKLRIRRKEQQPQREATKTAVRQMIRHLESNRVSYARATSEEAWRFARRQADVALQAVTWNETGSLSDRDLEMARNIEWLLENQAPGVRMVVWAHNGHILHRSRGVFDWVPTDVIMGRRLRMKFGADYLAIGLLCGEGTVRNLRISASTVLRPAAPGSVEAVMARVGLPIFALDLRNPGDADAVRWLSVPHATRFVGLNQSANATETFQLRDCYDGFVYFDRTTAARANPPR